MFENIRDISIGFVALGIFITLMINVILASKWFWQTYLGLQ